MCSGRPPSPITSQISRAGCDEDRQLRTGPAASCRCSYRRHLQTERAAVVQPQRCHVVPYESSTAGAWGPGSFISQGRATTSSREFVCLHNWETEEGESGSDRLLQLLLPLSRSQISESNFTPDYSAGGTLLSSHVPRDSSSSCLEGGQVSGMEPGPALCSLQGKIMP